MAVKELDDDKVIKKEQQSNTGIYVSGGGIEQGDYDTKDWSDLQNDYTKMRDGDEVISTSIEALMLPIKETTKNIMPGDSSEEARIMADYVNWSYDNLFKGFDYLKDHKLLSAVFGVSIHEIIKHRGYEYRDPVTNKKYLTNRIVKLSPIKNETVMQWNMDEVSDLISILHERRIPEKGSEQITIEADNLSISTFKEEHDDPRGRSLLRAVRRLWTYKNSVLEGKVTSIIRGAGIPEIRVNGRITSDVQKDINKMAKGITKNNPNSYVAYDVTKMELKLLTPQDQNDVMPLLEYFNRGMFYNTMTQFMASGIGQNGSRAATSEHKSSYELAANYVLKFTEREFQELTDLMIRESPWADQDRGKWPVFTFAKIKQVDIDKVTKQIEGLFKTGIIQMRPGDEDVIREMIGLPVKKLDQASGDDQETKEKELQLSQGPRRPWTKLEYRLEQSNDALMKIKTESEAKINDLMIRILKDAGSQLKQAPKKKPELRFLREFQTQMEKRFFTAFNMGAADVMEEASFLGKKFNISPRQETAKKNRILRAIDKLYFDLVFAIQDKIEVTTPEKIKEAGGLGAFLVTAFSLGFLGNKRKILSEVDSGYNQGRSDSQKKIESEVSRWFYSAQLDTNLCEVCAPLDGEILTTEQINESSSLHLSGSNVNTDCLGVAKASNLCRCSLIPMNPVENKE